MAHEAGCTLEQIRGRVREVFTGEASQAGLVIAGTAGHHGHGEAEDAINAVLFDAVAPLLLVPPAPPASLGARIAVAWERSQAADQAVQTALPLLLASDHVTVLVAQEGHANADLPAGIIEALSRSAPVQLSGGLTSLAATSATRSWRRLGRSVRTFW